MTSFNSTFVSCQVHHYKVKEIRVEQVRRAVIKKCYILHTGKYWPSFNFRFFHQQFSMREFKTGRIFLFIFEKNPHKHLQANLKLGEIFYWCIKAKVTRNENNQLQYTLLGFNILASPCDRQANRHQMPRLSVAWRGYTEFQSTRCDHQCDGISGLHTKLVAQKPSAYRIDQSQRLAQDKPRLAFSLQDKPKLTASTG